MGSMDHILKLFIKFYNHGCPVEVKTCFFSSKGKTKLNIYFLHLNLYGHVEMMAKTKNNISIYCQALPVALIKQSWDCKNEKIQK